MFKIDQVKRLFDCCLCNKLLVDPITLVCGNNVCKAHLGEKLDESDEKQKFRCDLCNKYHTRPEDGFVVNKQIQKAIDINFNKLKTSPVFDECKRTLEEATQIAANIESISSDPEKSIY